MTDLAKAAELQAYWRANRDPGCLCDWCGGGKHGVLTGDFAWVCGPKKGQVLTPDERRCQAAPAVPAPPPLPSYFQWGVGGYLKLNVDDGGEPKPVAPTGFNCTCCNERNDYAAANQPNGTYVCYRCR